MPRGAAHSRSLATALLAALGWLCVGPVGAVDAPKTAASHAPPRIAAPSWAQLTADQKEALAPLAADWDKFDPPRKKKWLEIAVRYKDLSPEGQQKMHERMPDLARLTPEQRVTARENFKRAYALPADKRRELTQQYQDLPDEKKRALAELAHKKPPPAPRRPGLKPVAPATARPASAAAAPGPVLPAPADTTGAPAGAAHPGTPGGRPAP